MRVRALITAVAVLVSVVGVVPAGPEVAGAAPVAPPPASTPLASCSSPPDSPDATAANRDRFVELWLPRIQDKAWFDAFTALDTVPDDLAAEGFHAMAPEVQLWLGACLVDQMVAIAGTPASPEEVARYQAGINLIIFGKQRIAEIRQEMSQPAPTAPADQPVPQELAPERLAEVEQELASQPSLTAADQPHADAPVPTVTSSAAPPPAVVAKLLHLDATASVTDPVTGALQLPAVDTHTRALDDHLALDLALDLNEPLIPQLLQALTNVEQLVAQIQATLFTIPGLNLLATLFYKVCAESATMPLRCSVSLPIGVPNLVDTDGNNLPDVSALLIPTTNLKDVGANVSFNRILTSLQNPQPSHVFVVYDTPIGKKRIEVGFDGRASTLAKSQSIQATLKDPVGAVNGDVQVAATVSANAPGSSAAVTFAVKSLTGGSIGVPPTEADPMAGAVQLTPFPTKLELGAHLVHTSGRDQDTFTVQSTTPSLVQAVVDQDTTTTTPKSHRRFTATVDKLPTSVTVDLLHQGQKQSIDYSASAGIAHVNATQTAVGDTAHPGSSTASQYDVVGVPDHVHVDLQGTQDVTYSASAKIPEVSFSTQTTLDGVLQQEVTAQAHQIPKAVHLTNVSTPDQTKVTYDSDEKLQDLSLSMYDKAQDEMHLLASATSIPTHLQMAQTKADGVFDFTANDGIGLIRASLTRGGGSILPLPGDHATVVKRGTGLGLDLQLSGFRSAHFDGSEDTTVSLGLSPGGQSFDALADLDDPDVLATAHLDALPADMALTLSSADGSATYQASSRISELDASFTKRDTQQFATVEMTALPKTIGLTFNTSGDTPHVTYSADSRLGSIDATYQEAPGAMALHGRIEDLPEYMSINGKDPIVFDARTSASAGPGSSHLGQVLFQYATDGTFVSPATPDDHLYLDTVDGTHAELQYAGLQFLSVDTRNQELHASLRNVAARLIRAYLTTPTVTLEAFIDKVPASIQLDQVGNTITYDASSDVDEIYTNLHRSVGDDLQVDITGVQDQVQVVFDAAGSKVTWDASDPTGGIVASAHLTAATLGLTRAFDAVLQILGIPAHWDASFGNGNVLFDAPDGIDTIFASVTNHGQNHVLSGDHLSAYYDQPTGDLDASLQVSHLRQAGFTKVGGATGGFETHLDMGDHSSFGLFGSVNLGTTAVTATGSISHLPTLVDLRSDGGHITYSGSGNPDLTLDVAAGAPAAIAVTPTAPSVHGVSVRDGASGGGQAVKAHVFLTGLPSSLDLNSVTGIYQVDDYHPTNAMLVINVVLDDIVAKAISLQVQQGVPTDSATDFTFGPFESTTEPDGTHSLHLLSTASQDLGALTAEAVYGNTDDAKLTISEIPRSIDVSAAFGKDQKAVTVAMDHGIHEIIASYKRTDDLDFTGSVKLTDVPATVNLVLGQASASGGGKDVAAPVFQFHTSDAGLDIDAFASADITKPAPADITAAATLVVTNLGKDVTASLSGTHLNVTSAPKTDAFLLKAAGSVRIGTDLDFEGGGFKNDGRLDVDIEVAQLTLGFTAMGTLTLDLGITTGLQGDFSQFTFGLDTDTTIHIQDDLDVHIDFGDPFGSANIDIFDIDRNIHFGDVLDGFRVASNTLGTIFSIPVVEVPLVGSCNVQIKARPGAGENKPGHPLVLGPPPAANDGGPAAWLITPDLNLLGLSLPGWTLDVIAFFESPYGNGIGFGFGCELFGIDL
jgi:hypothetical protein